MRTPGEVTRKLKDENRGTALVEFAVTLPILLVILLLTIEFGLLIQTRLILTNVSREGGSIASRETVIDDGIVTLLEASGYPLNLVGPNGRVFITRISAGLTEDEPKPTITTRISQGGLGAASTVATGTSAMGLTDEVYDRLVFDAALETAEIAEITVVEVFYKYRPFTPLPYVVEGALTADGDGVILSSTAIF
jgi:Flp pilus assembly protein TadG